MNYDISYLGGLVHRSDCVQIIIFLSEHFVLPSVGLFLGWVVLLSPPHTKV